MPKKRTLGSCGSKFSSWFWGEVIWGKVPHPRFRLLAVHSILEAWRLVTSKIKLEVVVQISELSIVLYILRSFVLDSIAFLIRGLITYRSLHLNHVRWWLSMALFFNVCHTFKKSLFLCGSASSDYGLKLLSI